MQENGSLPVPWGTGHPVGYWAYDLGPSLSGGTAETPPAGDASRVFKPGQVFAYDGFYCWPIEYQDIQATKTFSVEEMAVVTDQDTYYLIPPQKDLVLIKSR
jgi:hypothetical protein